MLSDLYRRDAERGGHLERHMSMVITVRVTVDLGSGEYVCKEESEMTMRMAKSYIVWIQTDSRHECHTQLLFHSTGFTTT